MTAQQREFFSGVNYYVPAMQAGGDLGQSLSGRISFGAIAVADTDGILDGQSINTAGSQTTFAAAYSSAIMGPWGRTVTVVASGAATSNVTVIGRDYLGQPMTESMTLNGTTPVAGVKAFKYVDEVTFGATSSVTIDLGFGARFGLPYKTIAVEREYADGVVASAGTLVGPVLTDPQTATTGDPRGLYTPTTTPNASKIIEIDAQFSNSVNASGNGGMHGVRHYNA